MKRALLIAKCAVQVLCFCHGWDRRGAVTFFVITTFVLRHKGFCEPISPSQLHSLVGKAAVISLFK